MTNLQYKYYFKIRNIGHVEEKLYQQENQSIK